MPWTTPITDWEETDYYNFHVDLERVEANIDYLNTLFATYGYNSGISSIVTGRTNESLVYYDDMNRIEGNIKKLKDCSFEPLTWETPNESWASASTVFDYHVANRLERNLQGLKDMMDRILASTLYCGEPLDICGDKITRF